MAHIVEYADPEYQLINGHCTNADCDNWATRYLVDDNGQHVPGSKLCHDCASKTLREYRTIALYWTARPIIMYRAGNRIFSNPQYADDYAAKLNKEQQQ